jgi:hypothetical protein
MCGPGATTHALPPMLPRHAPLPLRRHRSEGVPGPPPPSPCSPSPLPPPVGVPGSPPPFSSWPAGGGKAKGGRPFQRRRIGTWQLSNNYEERKKCCNFLSLSLLIAVAFLPVLNCWFVCWRKDWVNQRLPCSADSAAKILWLIEHTVTVAGSYSAKTAQRKFQKKNCDSWPRTASTIFC